MLKCIAYDIKWCLNVENILVNLRVAKLTCELKIQYKKCIILKVQCECNVYLL